MGIIVAIQSERGVTTSIWRCVNRLNLPIAPVPSRVFEFFVAIIEVRYMRIIAAIQGDGDKTTYVSRRIDRLYLPTTPVPSRIF